MSLDTDFVWVNDCVGRTNREPWVRGWFDMLCRLLGHNLWRTGSVRTNPDGSLPVKASYCRRCFKGGYVQGDYFR